MTKQTNRKRGAAKQTPYQRGVYAERKTVKLLKELGYDVVRSAGSKGKWDVCAVGHGQVRLISCKRDCWPSPKERGEFYGMGVPGGGVELPYSGYKAKKPVTLEVWRWDTRASEPIIRYENDWGE